MAAAGALVAGAIIAMKVLPFVPGSFSRWERTAFATWRALGLGFWLSRRRAPNPTSSGSAAWG